MSGGLFVVFEGGEGAGKSTQVRLLADQLRAGGHQVTITREPGGTPLAEQVRELLLTSRDDGDDVDDAAEALLYAAARAQHLARLVRPALDRGDVVICDRFVDSSIVYQGVARGLGAARVAELNRWAVGDTWPHLTVLLDIDADTGLRRVGEVRDRLESAGLDFHRTVNDAYRRQAAADPGRYLVLDATDDVDTLARRIATAVQNRLARQAA